MSAPDFIGKTIEELRAENIAIYESLSGRTLGPAQAEMLIVNAFTEIQYRTLLKVQYAAEQMLVQFANAPALDELARLVGVTRLPAESSSCTIRFTIVSGHSGVVIPSGTRIHTSDRKYVFVTSTEEIVSAGTSQVDLLCFSQEPGTEANGYAPGAINLLLDPLPFVTNVENTTTSTGGSSEETDQELRERIQVAPAQFSVAGSREAYEFYAKSANANIIDVAVAQTTPGTVGVYPLILGGVVTPQEILDQVEAALNQDTVIPLTDTVVVESPTVVNYNIEVDVTVLDGADSAEIQADVQASLQGYAESKETSMAQDITIAQIIREVTEVTDEIYDVSVVAPGANVVVDFNEVAVLGTLTVTIAGTNQG